MRQVTAREAEVSLTFTRSLIVQFACSTISGDVSGRGPHVGSDTTYTSQSMPSLIPLPSITEQATILQLRSRNSPSFSASEISPAPCAPG